MGSAGSGGRRALRGNGEFGGGLRLPVHGGGALPYPPLPRAEHERMHPRAIPPVSCPESAALLLQRSPDTAARHDLLQPPRPPQERALTAPYHHHHIPLPHSRFPPRPLGRRRALTWPSAATGCPALGAGLRAALPGLLSACPGAAESAGERPGEGAAWPGAGSSCPRSAPGRGRPRDPPG